MKKTVGTLAGTLGALALLPLVPILGITAATASTVCVSPSAATEGAQPAAGLDDPAVQLPNAQTIVATGVTTHIPARGQIIALATALQESGLRNLPYGRRDSLGLFQQRPSQGWGTAEQILDPAHASAAFYGALRRVPGWESLTVAQAAQAVQKSDAPTAYAKWEPLAIRLQAMTAPGLPTGIAAALNSDCGSSADDTAGFSPTRGGGLPPGYAVPADAPRQAQVAIRWALNQLGTPYQWGGHCTAPRGPDPMGRCDCSSLMQQSYRRAGITLPRTTYDQVRSGTPAPTTHPAPGDLVFTEGRASAPGHVGMYIGSGLIVHAPHTGAKVRVETYASWKPLVLAVRHIV